MATKKMLKIAVPAILLAVVLLGCDNADSLKKKGDERFAAGDIEQAITFYDKAIKKKPSAEIYYSRGYSYFQLEKYNSALSDFNDALNLDKDHADAYKWRGATYDILEDYPNAVSDLKNYTRVVKDDYVAFTTLSSIQYKIGDVDEAITAASAAIGIDPENTDGYNLRGYGYLLKKSNKAAADDFRVVLKIDPENSYAKENIAEIDRLDRLAARQRQRNEMSWLENLMRAPDPNAAAYEFGRQMTLDAFFGD